MIDRCEERAAHPEAQAEGVERLQAMERGNVDIARELLGM
jgi:hypothetical protein